MSAAFRRQQGGPKEGHVRRLQREARTLLDAGLEFDAEQVASILCTIAKAAAGQLPPFGPGSYALSGLLFSRALFAAGKVKRALHHATAASQYRRFASAVSAETKAAAELAQPGAVAPEATTPAAALMYALVELQAESLMRLGDHNEALRRLATIPPASRNLKVNLRMASLYRATRVDRAAADCYRAALRINPYAVSAQQGLLELGASAGKGEASLRQVLRFVSREHGGAASGASAGDDGETKASASAMEEAARQRLEQQRRLEAAAGFSPCSGTAAGTVSPRDLAWMTHVARAQALSLARRPRDALRSLHRVYAREKVGRW